MNEQRSTSRPQKYLLVDDHAGFRQTVRDFLPGDPVEVIECGNGVEAVQAFIKHEPDWTLMDIEMPVLDGLRALHSIRDHFPQARVVILTQHDAPELREQARASGASAYMLKDNLRDLPRVLSSLLQDSSPDSNPDSQS